MPQLFQERRTIEFMVMMKDSIGMKGLGLRSFWTVPRAGEYVQLSDERSTGLMYVVKAVCHAEQNAPTASDIIVEFVGSEVEMLKDLQPSR